jgi:hypothetical protein
MVPTRSRTFSSRSLPCKFFFLYDDWAIFVAVAVTYTPDAGEEPPLHWDGIRRGVAFGRVLHAWRKLPAPQMPILMFRREVASSEVVLLESEAM